MDFNDIGAYDYGINLVYDRDQWGEFCESGK